MYTWSRTRELKDFESLLDIVEPEEVESKAIKRCIQETAVYRCYVARHSKENTVDAFCIALWLPESKVLHIEDFTLNPRIRQQGHAKELWNGWWNYAINKEKWIASKDVPMTIEVYLYNVRAWNTIMNVDRLFQAPLYYNMKTIQWMGRNLEGYSLNKIYQEWLYIQQKEQARQANIRSKL
jgi:hypothetical protein